MSAKRISEFSELVTPQALAEFPVAYQGVTYRVKLGNIAAIIPLPTKAQIGLGNVDNTSDASKPVSAAQLAALNQKANVSHSHAESDITGLGATLSGFSSQLTNAIDSVNVIGTEVFGLTNSVSNILGRLSAVETKANTTEAGLGTLNATVTTMGSTVATINARVTANTNDIQTLFSDLSALSSRVGTTESAIVSLQGSNSSLVTQITTLTTNQNAQATALAGLTSRVAALETSSANHTTAINNLISEFNNHESRIVTLEQEIIGDVPTTVFTVANW